MHDMYLFLLLNEELQSGHYSKILSFKSSRELQVIFRKSRLQQSGHLSKILPVLSNLVERSSVKSDNFMLAQDFNKLGQVHYLSSLTLQNEVDSFSFGGYIVAWPWTTPHIEMNLILKDNSYKKFFNFTYYLRLQIKNVFSKSFTLSFFW